MLILLVSFAIFPLTVVYLAPAPPLMSLKAGVINLSVITIIGIFLSGLFFRRAFCGWLCPGAGCQLVSHVLNNQRIQQQKTNWFRIVAVGVWVVIMIATSEAQLQYLIDELEEENSEDQDYWINSTQIEIFKSKGADSSLIAMLESALGDNDDVEVIWERT